MLKIVQNALDNGILHHIFLIDYIAESHGESFPQTCIPREIKPAFVNKAFE